MNRTLGATASHSTTLLVVEDEELLLKLVESLLASEGYTVLTARDGETAVELYKRHHDQIALVLTDLGLPKMSGWDAFRIMRAIHPEVKVIVASGYLDPAARDEMAESGLEDFVQKAYFAAEIAQKVRGALASNTPVQM